MAEVQVILPKMGESVAEATITKWLKAEGDTIEAEESLVEIATDKVDSEVPAPADGIVAKILIQEGEVANVGDAIAIITGEGEAPESPVPSTASSNGQAKEATEPTVQATESKPQPVLETVEVSASSGGSIPRTSNSGKFYSPLVRNIAKQENISLQELEAIAGTGKNGRVTKKDILAYIPSRNGNGVAVKQPIEQPITEAAQPVQTQQPQTSNQAAASVNGRTEIIEMDRMRKLIAEHMVHSKHTSPHVTSFVEADVTNIVNWRNKIKNEFQQREGEKITFTPVFVQAVVKALRDYPMVNVSLDGDKIIKKNYINIGMAAALPSGNLIVPVIKDADHLNLLGLTKKVNDLANRARNNKLLPDEIQDGTFTLTNVGTFGNVMGTPIINQPQVAILATGAIQKKPAVVETPSGDTIAIRQMMFLSHSYDHRVVDGALGGAFVKRVAEYLEAFDVNTSI